jgi:hypothetical protein
MQRRFLVLHALAIPAHAICLVYSLVTESGYKTPVPAVLRRVSFEDASNSYYTIQDEAAVHLPSVVLIHGLVAFVTVVFHVCFYVPIHYRLATTVWEQGFFTLRWIEYAMTCTLMTASSVMSSGTTDLNFLITILVSGVVLQMVGCAIEQLRAHWIPLLIIGAGIELSLGWSLVWYTASSPTITSSQWVETLSFLFYYGLFPLNCVADAYYRRGCFVQTDWIYNVLSLTSKFALFWLQVGEVERTTLGGVWPEVQVYVLGTALPFLGLVAGVCARPSCQRVGSSERTDEQNLYWRSMSKLARLSVIRPEHPVKKKATRRRP